MYDEEGNLKRKLVIAIPILVVFGVVILLIVANWYRGMEEKKLEEALESNEEIIISDNVLNTEEPVEEITIEEAVEEYIGVNSKFKKYENIDKEGASIHVDSNADEDGYITYDEFMEEGSILDKSDTISFEGLKVVENSDATGSYSYYCYEGNSIVIVYYEDGYSPYINTEIQYSVVSKIANIETDKYCGYNIIKCTKRGDARG